MSPGSFILAAPIFVGLFALSFPAFGAGRGNTVSAQRARAAELAEARVCKRWMPVLGRLQPNAARTLATRPGGSDFAWAVRSHQPAWTEIPANRYRDLLGEWNYQLRAGLSGTTPPTREQARREMDRLIDNGVIRLWQASAKFYSVPSIDTITQIGLARKNGKRHLSAADFAAGGYQYIVSQGSPSKNDIDANISGRLLYYFSQSGSGYFLHGLGNTILTLNYSVNPGESKSGKIILHNICRR